MGSKIHAGRIEHPSAWTNERIGGKAGLLLAIRPEHQDAVFDLLEKTRDIPTTEVRRADFRHPAVDALMKDVHDILMHGRGVVIVTGLDISGMPVEDVERIYWGLGTHLGSGCVQSPALDRIGHVRKADSPTPRGYLSSLELKPHTDAHEAMSLMSVRKSASGGESGLVSALAIHNAIQETRPELLAPLYEGYWYAMHETRQDQSPMSDSKIPVFCNVDGKVSCLINPFFMHVAARMRGETCRRTWRRPSPISTSWRSGRTCVRGSCWSRAR
ncbi:MAG: TauD/TfdA family dioxygenase [Caulobacteraceae bacterium]